MESYKNVEAYSLTANEFSDFVTRLWSVDFVDLPVVLRSLIEVFWASPGHTVGICNGPLGRM